jgi:phosphate transport system substrate-binding protein
MGKHVMRATLIVGVTALAAAAWAATGSARPFSGSVSGSLSADGSSTVGPFASAAAEGFMRANKGANVTVGISGTGGGFERFCKGETDMSNASRPIKYSEAKKCQDAGIRYIQFLVANDGISLVANKSNTWANCLTVDELKKIWDKGSKVNSWSQVRSGFPDVPLKLYGPGTDSGTFEFFTEKINGKARQSRSDYNASEDDNVLVRGVSGDRGGLGYFGFSYYEENISRLKLIKVDSGGGCTAPSVKTVQSRAYKPLSRALFVYVKRSSFNKTVQRAFIKYIIVNEKKLAKTSKYVSLTPAQLRKAKRQYNTALGNRG